MAIGSWDPSAPTYRPRPFRPRHLAQDGNARRVSSTVCAYQLKAMAGEEKLDVASGACWGVFRKAVSTAHDWLVREAGGVIADRDDEFSFKLERRDLRARCVYVESDSLWAARLDRPDPDHPTVFWKTDLSIKAEGGTVQVGIRRIGTSTGGHRDELAPGPPSLVAELATKVGLRDAGLLFDDKPQHIEDESGLDAFRLFLENPERRLPCLVLTEIGPHDLPVRVDPFVLNPERLAKEAFGAAHVYALGDRVCRAWTDMVGKEWSVYRGAQRAYLPGLNFDRDEPGRHRLVLPERIIFCRHRDLNGEAAFERQIIERACLDLGAKAPEWGHLAFIDEAAQKRASVGEQGPKSAEEVVVLRNAELAELRQRLDYRERDVKRFQEEADRIKSTVEELRLEAEALRRRLERASDRLRQLGDPGDLDPPASYDELEAWCGQHFGGRLLFHARARRGLKKARFDDIGLVGEALRFLAYDYRNARLGQGHGHANGHGSGNGNCHDPGHQFQESLKALGLEMSRSITKGRAGEEGDTYFVEWPEGSGKKALMEWHLKKGIARDERHCLRIYFLWDADREAVVVGWLPSHLDIRTT